MKHPPNPAEGDPEGITAANIPAHSRKDVSNSTLEEDEFVTKSG